MGATNGPTPMNARGVADVIREVRVSHPQAITMDTVEVLVRNGLSFLSLLTPNDFPLNPLSMAQKRAFDNAHGASDWVRRKYNRSHLLTYKLDYVRNLLPELATHDPGRVLDLGPGFGEFMEICAALGHKPIGLDSSTGDEMGGEYCTLSRLMVQRQRLDVHYTGMAEILSGVAPEPPSLAGPFFLVNSQGSLEQMLDSCMEGSPLVNGEHGERKRTWWEDSATLDAMRGVFRWVHARLEPDGLFTIFYNGYPNHAWAVAQIAEHVLPEVGFVEVSRSGERFFKFKKVEPYALSHDAGAGGAGCPELGTGEAGARLDEVPPGDRVGSVDDPGPGNSPATP